MARTQQVRHVDLVYVGAVRDGDKRVRFAYAQLDDSGQYSERARLYDEPLTSHPVGSVVRFVARGRELFAASAAYIGPWRDPDESLAWQAASEAVMGTEATVAANPPARLSERLAPLRAAYQQLGALDRANLLSHVVRAIVGSDAQ